jgi:hypothetical protein
MRNQFYSLQRVQKRAIYYYRYFLSSAILLGIRQSMSAYSPCYSIGTAVGTIVSLFVVFLYC